MSTNKSIEVKNFYNKNPFPGKYSAQVVQNYTGENLYVSFISKFLHEHCNILDAGCGTGFLANYFANKFKDKQFTAIDFSNSVIHAESIAKKLGLENINFLKDDLCSWKHDHTFDVILCQGVLHHIPAYLVALENLKKLLKPNGIILVGLYHPWGKFLQKIMPSNYDNKVLEIDQEQHPFELSFTKRQVLNMFQEFELIDTYPRFFANYKNGGLKVYIFKKQGAQNDQVD